MDRKKSFRERMTPAMKEQMVRQLMKRRREEAAKKAQEETADRWVQYDTDLPSLSSTTGPELPEPYKLREKLPPAMTGPDEVIYNGKPRQPLPPSFVD